MALSVGFRITVSLPILLPKLRGSDSYPGGTVSHRTRQPSLDAQRLLCRKLNGCRERPEVAGQRPFCTVADHAESIPPFVRPSRERRRPQSQGISRCFPAFEWPSSSCTTRRFLVRL